MSYQKCPICQGTGSNTNPHAFEKCSVCKGEKIISELTGLPPSVSMPDISVRDHSIKYILKNGFDGTVIPEQKQ